MKRYCVFCGTNEGTDPVYRQAAVELARLLAERGVGIVYGGGNIGLMGLLADTALAEGGEVIGVFPKLFDRKFAHQKLTRLEVVDSMHERKALMEKLGDGFIALPGGYGTLEEISEAVTWAQLKVHAKPCALLNVKGYFDPFLAFLDRAVQEGFLNPKNRELLVASPDPKALLDLVETGTGTSPVLI